MLGLLRSWPIRKSVLFTDKIERFWELHTVLCLLRGPDVRYHGYMFLFTHPAFWNLLFESARPTAQRAVARRGAEWGQGCFYVASYSIVLSFWPCKQSAFSTKSCGYVEILA